MGVEVRISILFFVAMLLSPPQAQAYTDPGAGSLLIQLLLGGVAGLLVFARIYKQKLWRFLGLSKDKEDE